MALLTEFLFARRLCPDANVFTLRNVNKGSKDFAPFTRLSDEPMHRTLALSWLLNWSVPGLLSTSGTVHDKPLSVVYKCNGESEINF